VETNVYKRFLKYRLHPEDVLFFRCIPGNDGEWLFPILEAHFPGEAVFPPSAADSEAAYTRYPEDARVRFRLVRGDLEYGTGDRAVYHYLSPNPIKITWLRHPVGRALDLHQQALTRGRVAPNTSLADYVKSPTGRLDLCNGQARAVVGQTARATPGHDTLGYSLEAFQKLAEDNLEQHHFVGFAEEVQRSWHLLHYTFDWEPASPAHSAGAAPGDIDPELHAAILSRAEYDLAFYDYAHAMFERRCRQMTAELLDLESKWRAVGSPLPGPSRTTGLATRIVRAVRRRLPGYRTRARGQGRRKRAGRSNPG
jgi:hypothetical protein